MFKKLRKNEKGFTLAELLIVVAIIGVLVAISIPIFTTQLEKAREATDAANIRAAYAEVSSAYLTWNGTDDLTKDPYVKEVTAKQSQAGWQTVGDATDNKLEIGGQEVGAKTTNNKWTIKVDKANEKIVIE